MKRFFAVMVSVFFLLMSLAAYAEDGGGMITPGTLGVVIGGGQGGLNTDEIMENQYIYAGFYGEAPIAPGFNWRASVSYFANYEEEKEWYSSSTSMSAPTETYRFLTGPSLSGVWKVGSGENETYWWMWNLTAVGTDYQVGEGWQPVWVLQEENMIGVGSYFNFLTATFRFGEDYDETYFIRDQGFVRVLPWLALGPQVVWNFFKQPDEDCLEGEECDLNMVYESAFGGQVRLGPNEDDPNWALTAGATSGEYVGTTWHVDFWMRFDSADWVK